MKQYIIISALNYFLLLTGNKQYFNKEHISNVRVDTSVKTEFKVSRLIRPVDLEHTNVGHLLQGPCLQSVCVVNIKSHLIKWSNIWSSLVKPYKFRKLSYSVKIFAFTKLQVDLIFSN